MIATRAEFVDIHPGSMACFFTNEKTFWLRSDMAKEPSVVLLTLSSRVPLEPAPLVGRDNKPKTGHGEIANRLADGLLSVAPGQGVL